MSNRNGVVMRSIGDDGGEPGVVNHVRKLGG